MEKKTKVLVWDVPTRVFHWLLALSFAGAFVTAESERYRDVHVMLGYTVLGLVAAGKLADGLVYVVGDAGGYALLLGLFVLTAVLGQLISNMATALIMIPVALSAAAEVDISPRPVLMSLTVAAAASFLTPVATPANLMVMRPGGYRFGDYWKLGLPILLFFGVISVLLVPVIWSF